MAWKNPTNQPIEDVKVPDSEDDGEEPDNFVHTSVLHPPCFELPPQEKLKVSENDKSKEESKEEEEEEDDEEEIDESEGESGEEEEHGSPIRGPTQSKGGVSEINITIMTNSAARNEETDELDKKKMETEMRIEYLGIFLGLIEVQRPMLKLKRKARQHNIKIKKEESDG